MARITEDDADVRIVAPLIAHAMWGQSDATMLRAAQRRQARNIAQSIVVALRNAGRLPENADQMVPHATI